MEISLRGIGVSPGVAIGPVVTFHVQAIEPPRYGITDPVAELARYDAAVEKVRSYLLRTKDRMADEVDEQHASIFLAHLVILDDVALRPEIERRLNTEKINVDFLVQDLISEYTKLLANIEDPMVREKIADFSDVGRRILHALLDREVDSLERLEHPCVIVAGELSPSETANMDMANTMGLATDEGGRTSHMAILARAFELPAVVGLRYISKQVMPGDTIIVDGTNGVVVIRPTQATIVEYLAEKNRQEEERRALIRAGGDGPCLTQDGVQIETFANIDLPIEASEVLKTKCMGVGLYRTEYLFMNRDSLPSEDTQYRAYKLVLKTMAPLPVTLRTLDIGGDKMVSYLSERKESNPQLGWRSIRFCLDRPDIFKAQLRAMYRASVHGNMRIKFPMISGLDELREAMASARQVREDLTARGVAFDPKVKIGCMIEIAAAVVLADKLAEECDFFSIGTNDLIQYALAVDRTNERTAHLYDPSHPGVLRLLKQTIDTARAAGIPCAICGEMAGDPLFTELLVGMGFDSLSMSAVSLPQVRAEIANTRGVAAKRLAKTVLSLGSAQEIRELLVQRSQARATLQLYRTDPAAGEA